MITRPDVAFDKLVRRKMAEYRMEYDEAFDSVLADPDCAETVRAYGSMTWVQDGSQRRVVYLG